jgi:hypothetical protein
MWVIWAKRLFQNSERTSVKRFGFVELILSVQQYRQIVQVSGNIWMTGAVSFFIDSKRTSIEWLSDLEFALSIE